MEILAESAVRVTALAAGVAVVLRALRIRSPWLMHGAWTGVVVTMLLLPMLVAWGPELAMPILPADSAGGLLSRAGTAAEPAGLDASLPTIAPAGTTQAQQRLTWTAAAAAVYLAGVGFFLLRLALGLRRARAIRRGAVRVDGRMTHPACVAPITVGAVAPVVILPSDWTSWNEAELSAVLAHEEEHVRRRDPLVATIALLNCAIFWFHPLAWWLRRTTSRLAEQACDAAVISRGHDSDLYLSCLLRFARRVSDVGGRIAPTTIAMPGAGLQERLGMLGRPAVAHSSCVRLLCTAGACAVLVVVCAAAAPTAAPRQGVPLSRNQAVWTTQTSEHFEIFHLGLPADRVNDAVSDAEAAYAQLSAALKHDLSRRVRIVLVRRDRDVADTAGQFRDVVLPDIDPTEQRVVISLESLDRRTGTIVHELTHQFAFDIVPDTSRLEPVLMEGLAEHQRGIWAVEDLRQTRDAAEVGRIPSVTTLSPADRHWAHAVFDYVAVRYGAEGIRQLLFALRAHGTLEQSVPMAFGMTPDQFDQGFRGYVTARYGQP